MASVTGDGAVGVSEDLAIGPELSLELIDVQGVDVRLTKVADCFVDCEAELLAWSRGGWVRRWSSGSGRTQQARSRSAK